MSYSWYKFGKIIYSIPLSVTGLIYLVNPQGTVETLTSFIPGGLALIYFGGVLWLLFGLAIAFNFFTRFAAWGIIYLLGAYVIMIHVPALTTGEHMNVVLFEFLRNLSLMSGAFFILSVEAPAHKKAERKLLGY
ncbi:MAG: hypothetical protein BWZ03_00360 [bacterium ADurb.BinA186]|nr:MAG: hypothetical protein BWZ03_00360 [bacterium ADurb.BinA186]